MNTNTIWSQYKTLFYNFLIQESTEHKLKHAYYIIEIVFKINNFNDMVDEQSVRNNFLFNWQFKLEMSTLEPKHVGYHQCLFTAGSK